MSLPFTALPPPITIFSPYSSAGLLWGSLICIYYYLSTKLYYALIGPSFCVFLYPSPWPTAPLLLSPSKAVGSPYKPGWVEEVGKLMWGEGCGQPSHNWGFMKTAVVCWFGSRRGRTYTASVVLRSENFSCPLVRWVLRVLSCFTPQIYHLSHPRPCHHALPQQRTATRVRFNHLSWKGPLFSSLQLNEHRKRWAAWCCGYFYTAKKKERLFQATRARLPPKISSDKHIFSR